MFQTIALPVIRAIDRFTGKFVYLVTLLLVPMILANVVEVFMRYVLGTPTIWAADVTVMTYGSLFMLGSAYTLFKGAHVRTDISGTASRSGRKGSSTASRTCSCSCRSWA